MNDIIEILKECISKYDDNIKEINKKIEELRPIYNIFKPKKNSKYNLSYIRGISGNIRLISRLYDVVKKYDNITFTAIVDEAEELKKKIDEIVGNTDGVKNNFAINDSIAFTDFNKIRRIGEVFRLEEEYRKKKECIVKHCYDVIVNTYEVFVEEKEKLKDVRNPLRNTLSDIKNNRMLNTAQIALITNFLMDTGNENLVPALNEYIKSKTPKIKKVSDTSLPIKNTENIRYVDSNDDVLTDENIEEDNNVYNNYILVLSSFDNADDVTTFLESLGDESTSLFIANNILQRLDDDNSPLKLYIQTFINSHASNDDENLENSGENILLFYDFMSQRNKIFSDMSNISTNEYDHILKGLEMIKKGVADYKGNSIVCINKVHKLSIGKIRIVFKRLNKNIYVILGIFRKQDMKGYYIIDTAKKRDIDLISKEKLILDAYANPELWKKYMEDNDVLKKEIGKKLGGKNKRLVHL